MDDAVFRALGDPTRRALLDRLYERQGQSLGELEREFAMSRFGVMKHLRVLEDAGLVVSRKVGRERLHYLNAVPIREVHDRWIGKFAAGASAALLDLRTTIERGRTMTSDPKPSAVFVVFIRATPEHVWEAITSSDFTRQYYFASTVESDWKPGSPYVYAIDGEDTAIVGEVVESDPPQKLVCTFDARWDEQVAPDPPSRITWELAPAGEGITQLTVVHDGFDSRTATFEQVNGGMPFILSGLKTLLETGEPLQREAVGSI
jgi:uncharacterized protein YndB with AHSA1/START domain/DNA-binding transcriptional ArsR family regulator